MSKSLRTTFALHTFGFVVIVVDADVVLPYAGTSGWSGTSTSRERAVNADRDGTTKNRQRLIITALRNAGADGLTWRELSGLTGWHHGTASGALSVLHKSGLISRLKDSRNRCKIYVSNDYVLDRVTESYGGKKPAIKAVENILCGCFCCSAILDRLEKM